MPYLDANKQFNSKIFGLDKIEDLQFLSSVDISTLAVSLNCYVESTGSGARLVFPRKTIRKYVSFTPHFSIKPFVNMIPQMLDKGAIFEILMGSFIIWMTKCGFIQNLTFSKVFPFLVGSALENILCVDLNSNEITTKVTKKETKTNSEKNAINFWKKIDLQDLYYGQSSIVRPAVKGYGRISDIREIKVPKNVTVIIVDETKVKDVIGVENFIALAELADIQPHNVDLI
ncbi:hypothetical protein ABK040_006692 [Willaertia magna]